MTPATRGFREMKSVVVRFAGDSGDGMQIVGERFTDTSVTVPNAIATFPDYPAEIRAPVGTIAGVSAFQVHFGSQTVLTPGDEPDALVAMNPAALAVHLYDLAEGGLLIVNSAAFTEENLAMAGFSTNPLDDPGLRKKYEVIPIDITGLAVEALKASPITLREKLRTKNFFALGFTYWVYGRPLEPTIDYINSKWAAKAPDLAEANIRVLKAGYFLGETTETTRNRYMVARAEVEPGTYRKISGNEAVALGLLAGAKKAGRDLLFSGYPITPASSVLEALASFKHFGVKTVQAEDEIAAIGVALGASFAGQIGVTATSGPGMCLKSEFIGLAISTELPLVIVNVQRGGPSTGLPTKTEQSDLLQALYGRHGESPLPVVAANSPSDCFRAAFEAVRIALEYSTPVILLSDGYLANGSEPWKIPDETSLPEISKPFADTSKPYVTFARDPETLARTQAIPGQPGLEHRIGGLEKNETGSISYDSDNHSEMTRLRAAKVEAVASSIPPLRITGEKTGKLLVLGWGGTHGAITSAVETLRAEGYDASSTNLRYLNPLPPDLGGLLKGFEKVLIPELNSGQLALLIRAKYLVDAISMNKIKGRPFKVSELRERILQLLND
jgi:2-oxoglutarate ferredoxin oxidoreductase subunit alpha